MTAPGKLEERCPRCGLPRSEWSENVEGYARIEHLYSRGDCADGSGSTCLEAGAGSIGAPSCGGTIAGGRETLLALSAVRSTKPGAILQAGRPRV
jgi:hypothetical protein